MGVLFTVYALALIGIATNNHRMFVEAGPFALGTLEGAR